MGEEELLRRCQQGDEQALAELIRRFQRRIFALAYRVLGDEARADDATADALATIWLRAGSWQGISQAGTWIQQVAWRKILDHARQRSRWWRFSGLLFAPEMISGKDHDPAHHVAAEDEREQLATELKQAMDQLHAEERALVHWHYFEEQSLADISEILGVSRDALKMRLSRVRHKLAAIWGRQHE